MGDPCIAISYCAQQYPIDILWRNEKLKNLLEKDVCLFGLFLKKIKILLFFPSKSYFNGARKETHVAKGTEVQQNLNCTFPQNNFITLLGLNLAGCKN